MQCREPRDSGGGTPPSLYQYLHLAPPLPEGHACCHYPRAFWPIGKACMVGKGAPCSSSRGWGKPVTSSAAMHNMYLTCRGTTLYLWCQQPQDLQPLRAEEHHDVVGRRQIWPGTQWKAKMIRSDAHVRGCIGCLAIGTQHLAENAVEGQDDAQGSKIIIITKRVAEHVHR